MNKIPKPRAKIGDVVVVELLDDIFEEVTITSSIYRVDKYKTYVEKYKWYYNINNDEKPFYDEDILYNLTTGEDFTKPKKQPVAPRNKLRGYFDQLNLYPKLQSAWEDFEQLRVNLKKPLTSRAAKIIAKRLNSQHPVVARFMLDKSIEMGWKGVFDPKPEDERMLRGRIAAFEKKNETPKQKERRSALQDLMSKFGK